MSGELTQFVGATNGTATTGTVYLYNNYMYVTGSTPYVPIPVLTVPIGTKLKVWGIRVSGSPVVFNIQYSPTALSYYTGGTPSWATIESVTLSSPGELYIALRRPIVLPGKYGTEGVQVTWSQSSAAVSVISLDVEIVVTAEDDEQ